MSKSDIPMITLDFPSKLTTNALSPFNLMVELARRFHEQVGGISLKLSNGPFTFDGYLDAEIRWRNRHLLRFYTVSFDGRIFFHAETQRGDTWRADTVTDSTMNKLLLELVQRQIALNLDLELEDIQDLSSHIKQDKSIVT